MRMIKTLACLALLTGTALVAGAQQSSSAATDLTRMDIFAGYSYWSPYAKLNGFSYNNINEGMIFSGTYYLNHHWGAQVEGDYHIQNVNDGMKSISAGPVYRIPTLSGFTPFLHVLGGAASVTGPNIPTIGGHSFQFEPATWGPQLTAGGGVDYNLSLFRHHLGLRLFQADFLYEHINFGTVQQTTGGSASIEALRLSAGVVYHPGTTQPPAVEYSCSANPDHVYPGDLLAITGTATNLRRKKIPAYSWHSEHVSMASDSPTENIQTTGLQPGTYTVAGHVSDGPKPGQSADCMTSFTVKAYDPPTVSCSANPSIVKQDDPTTITAHGMSPQNRPLTYSYSTTAGLISGTGSTATLSTMNTTDATHAGAITVTCNVVDDIGQTASSTTTVGIEVPPPPPAPKTQQLCSLNVDRDLRRPARVDNAAKACLDDVTLSVQRQPDAFLVLVGNSSADEQPDTRHDTPVPENRAGQRAVNTKDYLVKEKGIDASRIHVRAGNTGTKEVQIYLVPAGVLIDSDVQGTTVFDESAVKPQARKAPAHK